MLLLLLLTAVALWVMAGSGLLYGTQVAKSVALLVWAAVNGPATASLVMLPANLAEKDDGGRIVGGCGGGG